MEFHFDSFTAPPTSEVLARSERCDQAFRQGANLGVQFHPEITPAEFEIWAGRWTGTALEASFPELGISTDALRAEVAERAESSRVRAWRLFDEFGRTAGLVHAGVGSHVTPPSYDISTYRQSVASRV